MIGIGHLRKQQQILPLFRKKSFKGISIFGQTGKRSKMHSFSVDNRRLMGFMRATVLVLLTPYLLLGLVAAYCACYRFTGWNPAADARGQGPN
jgi:hypothetical protein